MRRTRFMTLLFLVLSGAFFLLPDFRQGLHGPLLSLVFRAQVWGWLEEAGRVEPEMLRQLASTAERERDRQTLAFVALHLPWSAWRESARLAGQAAEIDPQFSWVYWNVASQQRSAWQQPEVAQAAEAWIAQAERWDSENAVAHLLRAEWLYETRGLRRYRGTAEQELAALEKETAWRSVMEQAFASPRYDSYARRRFELERAVLRKHGLAKPAVLLWSLANYPAPHLSNVRHYANLLAKFGREALETRQPEQAMGHYWTIAHFGERMQVGSRTAIEKRMATQLQLQAYEFLLPLLRQQHRIDGADTVAYALEQLHAEEARLSGEDPFAQSSNYNWAALTVHLLAALVAVFGVLTLLSVGYVNVKRWVRPEHKGRLYQLLTVGENYAPLLLFFACLGLYMSYYPYAQNFRHYMTANGEIHDFAALWLNIFPNYGGLPGRAELGVENPFVPYLWYALAGVGLLAAALWVKRR